MQAYSDGKMKELYEHVITYKHENEYQEEEIVRLKQQRNKRLKLIRRLKKDYLITLVAKQPAIKETLLEFQILVKLKPSMDI